MSDATPGGEQPTLPEATPAPEAVKPDDGSVVVKLVTTLGEADIRVPPRNKWRSMARNRLTQGDDLGWAALTLSQEDAEAWIDLDPDQDESGDFFAEFNRLAPQGNNRAERRAGRHLRAAS